MENYNQKVVWIGTVLGDSSTDEFEEFFLNNLGYRVKYDWEFKMKDGFYKGLNCIVFNLCYEDIPKFALFRITTSDIKWLEDFMDNEEGNFPDEFIDKYKDYLN